MKSTHYRIRFSGSTTAQVIADYQPDPAERKKLRRAEILSRRARLLRRCYKAGTCTRETLQKAIDLAEVQYGKMLESGSVPAPVLQAHNHFFGPQAR